MRAVLLLLAALAGASCASSVPSTLAGLRALPRRSYADRCEPETRALMNACQDVLDEAWAKYEDTTFFAGTRAFSFLHELVDRKAASSPALQGLDVLTKAENKDLLDVNMRARVATRLTCFRALGNAEVEGAHTMHPDCFHVSGRAGTTCLFFHGPGYKGPAEKHLTKAGEDARFVHRFELDFKDTGNVLENNKECEPLFYSTETLERGWEDASYQQELCAAIQAVQPDQVFSSSVASLALAAGAARGVKGCDQLGRGAFDAQWYPVMSPFRGAPVDFVEQVCKSCVSFLASAKGYTWVYENKLTSAGVCAVLKPFFRASFCTSSWLKYSLLPAYRSLRPGFVNQRAHYAQAATAIDASDEGRPAPAPAVVPPAADGGEQHEGEGGGEEEQHDGGDGPAAGDADKEREAPATTPARRRPVCNCPTKTNYRQELNRHGEGGCDRMLRATVSAACVETCRTKSAYRTAKSTDGKDTKCAETALALLLLEEREGSREELATPQLACGESERAVPGPACVTLHSTAARLAMGEMCGFNTGASDSPERWWNAPSAVVAEKAFGIATHAIGSDWGEGDAEQRPPQHGADGFTAAHSCVLAAAAPGSTRAAMSVAPYSARYAIQTHAWGARCTNQMRTTSDPKRDPCTWYIFAAGNTKARVAYELGVECGEGGEAGAGACAPEVRRLLDLLRHTLPSKAKEQFDREAGRETKQFENDLAASEARREVELLVDDFIAALDDNRDREVSSAEFRWWEVMQGGRLEMEGSAEPVVYATFDGDTNGHLTTAELRGGLLSRQPSRAAVHALTDRVREWHWAVTRLALRAGAAPAPTRLTRLVKEGRWQELVQDLYLGAYKRHTNSGDAELMRARFGLTDWDVDTLEKADQDGTLPRMAGEGLVRLYQETRSKNRAPAAIFREFFDGLDTSMDGAVSRPEVEQFLEHCGGFCERAAGEAALPPAAELLSSRGWDRNGDGSITPEEFEEALTAGLATLGADAVWEISAGVRDAGRAAHAAVAFAKRHAEGGAGEEAAAAAAASGAAPFEAMEWIRERRWDTLHAEYRRVFHGDGEGEHHQQQEQEQEQEQGQQPGAGGEDGGGEAEDEETETMFARTGAGGLPETRVTFLEVGGGGGGGGGQEPLDAASLSLLTSFELPVHYMRDVTKALSETRDSEARLLLAEARREAAEERDTAATERREQLAAAHTPHATGGDESTHAEAVAEEKERAEVLAMTGTSAVA